MENQWSFDLTELHENPFGPAADASRPYLSSSFREAIAALYYGLEYGSRILILTADRGLGKTTLLRYFERWMHGRGHILLLSPGHDKTIEVLGKLLAAVEGTATCDDLHSMRGQVDGILSGIAKAENPFILLLDCDENAAEATLEVLLYLARLESFEKRLLRIVIAGSPDVAEKLQGSALADQVRRVPLAPLTVAEVESYINYRLRLAGWRGGRLFTAAACKIIAQRSSANPSAINAVCFDLLQNLAEQESSHADHAQTKDAAIDESYVEFVTSAPQPITLISTHSFRRWKAILACMILMLALVMAGLWYRSGVKERAAKHVSADIAVAAGHPVTAPAPRSAVPSPTPASSLVQQGTTETHTVAARTMSVTPQGDSSTHTTDEMAAYEIRLGDAYMNAGEYDKALGSFSRANALAPNNKEAEERIERARRAKATEKSILQ